MNDAEICGFTELLLHLAFGIHLGGLYEIFDLQLR